MVDEPTNDIDLDTLTALEDYLEEYQGVLVIVSHDRFFTDKVTNHLFVFEGNGIVKDFTGTLSDYSECLVELEKSSPSSNNGSKTMMTTGGNVDDSEKQQSYKEDKQQRMQKMNEFKKNKKEMTKIEKDIEKLKDEIIKLEKDIEVSSDDGWSKLAELTDKMNDKIALVDEKEMRWLELAEMIEEFESQQTE
jgi:ATP-binding cassette subfamily F protein uup